MMTPGKSLREGAAEWTPRRTPPRSPRRRPAIRTSRAVWNGCRGSSRANGRLHRVRDGRVRRKRDRPRHQRRWLDRPCGDLHRRVRRPRLRRPSALARYAGVSADLRAGRRSDVRASHRGRRRIGHRSRRHGLGRPGGPDTRPLGNVWWVMARMELVDEAELARRWGLPKYVAAMARATAFDPFPPA